LNFAKQNNVTKKAIGAQSLSDGAGPFLFYVIDDTTDESNR